MTRSLAVLSSLSCLFLASPLFAGLGTPAPVPEPATFALVGLAAGGLLLVRHFRKGRDR
jgi:PEP-CTERM motif